MGWAVELFVAEDEAREFECSICLEVPKHPAMLRCNHIFCKKCLKKWLRQQCWSSTVGFNCPLCRNRIRLMLYEHNTVPATYATYRLKFDVLDAPQVYLDFLDRMNALEMKCINESTGCNVRMLYSQFKKHIKDECQFRNGDQG